jgi:hypothetical protein
MKKLLFIVCLYSFASAQTPDDFLDAACGVDGLAWVCDARALVLNIQTVAEDIFNDFEVFAETNFEQFLQDGLEYVVSQLDLGEVEEFVDDISTAIREGPEELTETLQARLDEARNEAFSDTPNNYPPQSPDWWSAYARRANPNLTAADAVTTDQGLRLLERSMQSEAANEKAKELAESVTTFNAVTQKLNEVLGTPVLGQIDGLGDGEAQQLRNNATTAVSTRAGIRYLTEGIATMMEQEAVYTQGISSKLTIQIQQQSLTNHQLNVLARTLAEERMSEMAQAKAELQAEIEGDYERGEALAQTLTMTEGWMRPSSLETSPRRSTCQGCTDAPPHFLSDNFAWQYHLGAMSRIFGLRTRATRHE